MIDVMTKFKADAARAADIQTRYATLAEQIENSAANMEASELVD